MPISIRRIGKIEKTYQHFKRFEEIIYIVFKYGLQDAIRGFDLPGPLKALSERVWDKKVRALHKEPFAKRLRLALIEMGPTFVKFGQIMSMRVEFFSSDIIEELTQLQDAVPPFPFEEVEKTVTAELGGTLHKNFPQFEEEPIGSASLGQVHRARLPDGRRVVVKVQRPQIKGRIEIDLEIMMHLAEWAENNIEEFQYRRPAQFLEEFAYAIERELDYKQEEANIQRFQELFRSDPGVHIMGCYPDLSTERVLTLEEIEGVKVRELGRLDQEGFDRRVLADRGVDCVLSQIFDHGFFHADPHPGNIFATTGNVVSFIDFGMVGRLNRRHRELMADFLYAVNQRDAGRAVKYLVKITPDAREADLPRLEKEIGELIDRYVSKPIKEVSFAELFARLSGVLADHHMTIPADFSMMLKSISTLEGVGRSLDPDINLTRKLVPYLYRLRIARLRPTHVAGDITDSTIQFAELFQDIPEKVRDFLQLSLKGESQLRVEHRQSESFKIFWNQLTNRLAVALILSALLIGSSIIVLSGLPPKWNDIPIVGLIGFILAGLMSLSLLFSIWRSGKF
ncbi:MAG: hypothetical protein H6756_04995 [Candidatus Omnitrophica bacterium]|nr:hypothetical protein [Candidatus Omnitrophota bacterium]